uniref:D-glycerate dehydrogenase n=1 Tax=candidate division WOR-3 bacterium TaxID=2052148 RepID=A0A7C4YFF1_UNCW3
MKVFVTYPFPEDWIKELKVKYETIIFEENRKPTKEEIIKNIKDASGILCLLRDKIDEEIISKAISLKVISNYAVGYDNIDIDAAKRRNIVVTNTPDVLTNAVAELTLAILLAAIRKIVEADRFVREGRFQGWDSILFLGYEIKDSITGIIGAGRIGAEFGRKIISLGGKVIYYNRKENETLDKLGARKVSLEELIKSSDFISLHLPLTKETYHIIGEKEIMMMKKNAFIVNTGRGPLIDERALADALNKGIIEGAALDVFEFEPGVTTELLRSNKVVLTPHIGSATKRTRENMARIAVQNIINVLEGKEPLYRVV